MQFGQFRDKIPQKLREPKAQFPFLGEKEGERFGRYILVFPGEALLDDMAEEGLHELASAKAATKGLNQRHRNFPGFPTQTVISHDPFRSQGNIETALSITHGFFQDVIACL